jgi:predicted nucleic acid-binding protein
MAKIKIYLDTSVLSYLVADNYPEKQKITRMLWELIESELFEIVISDLVIDEVGDCQEPKRQLMFDLLRKIQYDQTNINDEVENIAEEVIRLNILKRKQLDDCTHIGCAVYSGSDFLISWNFRHLANDKTVNGARKITELRKYKELKIMSPAEFLILGGYK